LGLTLHAWRFRGAAALLAVFGLALLASCSYIPFIGSKKSEKAAGPACPAAVILHPLANTAVFNPTAPKDLRPLDVAWYGVYSDISVSCTITGDTLHAVIDSVVVAERGPAAKGNDVDFYYFVSLTGSDQTILGKKVLGVHVTMPDKAKRSGVSDHVELAFAMGGHSVADLNITAGFQQSQQAIQFYKNFRGR
jgi:hypothetical protein